MEKSRWCDVCKRTNCKHDGDKSYGGVPDMGHLKPSCYVEIEMVKFDRDTYVPRELCTTDRMGGIDDCSPCNDACTGENCSECIVPKVFNEYARLTKQI